VAEFMHENGGPKEKDHSEADFQVFNYFSHQHRPALAM
jgi:hypothetical protein